MTLFCDLWYHMWDTIISYYGCLGIKIWKIPNKHQVSLKKYLCVMHASFPGAYSSYNDVMLNVMSEWFLYCYFRTIT